MESGYSVVNDLPRGFSPDYDLFLFQQPQHLGLQGEHWITFYLLKKNSRKVMAQVSFHVDASVARTPLRAPFGSYLFSEKLSPFLLYEFVRECEAGLRLKSVKSVLITEPPLFYRASGELIHTILLNQGYRVSKAEVSSGIPVENMPFERKIEQGEKGKLRQAKTRGVKCRLLDLEKLPEVYKFLSVNLLQKGYSLSMEEDEIKKTASQFPGDFLLFGAYMGEEMIAASIAVKVHQSILYNFYCGHLKKYDSLSPMVTLVGCLYDYCRVQGIALLDLGTSAMNGHPNFSLLDFKLRLGAMPSMKVSFEKNLS